jgi:hypothetical protein
MAIDLGQAFVDAHTGEIFLFAPTRKGAEVANTWSGTASTPLGGPYATRVLNIVRESGTSTYQLRDTSHARDIITYDVAGSTRVSASPVTIVHQCISAQSCRPDIFL